MEFQEHKRLIELLPDFLQRYREYQAIMNAEQAELDSIHQRISGLLSDVFIDTATEEGIAHRERMCGILPAENATLEERRSAVKAKENQTLPYTIRQYRQMLASLCGEGYYQVELCASQYQIHVKVRVGRRSERDAAALLSTVDSVSRQVLPANLCYQSALFDSHTGSHTTCYGAAVCVRKQYNVEVM